MHSTAAGRGNPAEGSNIKPLLMPNHGCQVAPLSHYCQQQVFKLRAIPQLGCRAPKGARNDGLPLTIPPPLRTAGFGFRHAGFVLKRFPFRRWAFFRRRFDVSLWTFAVNDQHMTNMTNHFRA